MCPSVYPLQRMGYQPVIQHRSYLTQPCKTHFPPYRPWVSGEAKAGSYSAKGCLRKEAAGEIQNDINTPTRENTDVRKGCVEKVSFALGPAEPMGGSQGQRARSSQKQVRDASNHHKSLHPSDKQGNTQ